MFANRRLFAPIPATVQGQPHLERMCDLQRDIDEIDRVTKVLDKQIEINLEIEARSGYHQAPTPAKPKYQSRQRVRWPWIQQQHAQKSNVKTRYLPRSRPPPAEDSSYDDTLVLQPQHYQQPHHVYVLAHTRGEFAVAASNTHHTVTVSDGTSQQQNEKLAEMAFLQSGAVDVNSHFMQTHEMDDTLVETPGKVDEKDGDRERGGRSMSYSPRHDGTVRAREILRAKRERDEEEAREVEVPAPVVTEDILQSMGSGDPGPSVFVRPSPGPEQAEPLTLAHVSGLTADGVAAPPPPPAPPAMAANVSAAAARDDITWPESSEGLDMTHQHHHQIPGVMLRFHELEISKSAMPSYPVIFMPRWIGGDRVEPPACFAPRAQLPQYVDFDSHQTKWTVKNPLELSTAVLYSSEGCDNEWLIANLYKQFKKKKQEHTNLVPVGHFRLHALRPGDKSGVLKQIPLMAGSYEKYRSCYQYGKEGLVEIGHVVVSVTVLDPDESLPSPIDLESLPRASHPGSPRQPRYSISVDPVEQLQTAMQNMHSAAHALHQPIHPPTLVPKIQVHQSVYRTHVHHAGHHGQHPSNIATSSNTSPNRTHSPIKSVVERARLTVSRADAVVQELSEIASNLGDVQNETDILSTHWSANKAASSLKHIPPVMAPSPVQQSIRPADAISEIMPGPNHHSYRRADSHTNNVANHVGQSASIITNDTFNTFSPSKVSIERLQAIHNQLAPTLNVAMSPRNDIIGEGTGYNFPTNPTHFVEGFNAPPPPPKAKSPKRPSHLNSRMPKVDLVAQDGVIPRPPSTQPSSMNDPTQHYTGKILHINIDKLTGLPPSEPGILWYAGVKWNSVQYKSGMVMSRHPVRSEGQRGSMSDQVYFRQTLELSHLKDLERDDLTIAVFYNHPEDAAGAVEELGAVKIKFSDPSAKMFQYQKLHTDSVLDDGPGVCLRFQISGPLDSSQPLHDFDS